MKTMVLIINLFIVLNSFAQTNDNQSTSNTTWRILADESDPITDERRVIIACSEINSNLYNERELLVRVTGEELELYIAWDDYIGNSNPRVIFRINDEAPITTTWGISSSGVATFVPYTYITRILSAIISGSRIVVRVEKYTHETITAIFNTQGYLEIVSPLQITQLLEPNEDVENQVTQNNAVQDASVTGKPPVSVQSVSSRIQSLMGLTMIRVEGGSFIMGLGNDGSENEQPVRNVTINSFLISMTETTQSQFYEICGRNPAIIGNDNTSTLPIERVSWFDAINFCNLLSEREGLQQVYQIIGFNVTYNVTANGYRLPTEAEWEYAARGGNQTSNFRYSGSNSNSDSWNSSTARTITNRVMRLTANELGIYDMSGNVNEWCWDWYGFYNPERIFDPIGLENGSNRVIRGGAFNQSDEFMLVTKRQSASPYVIDNSIGFRVARNAE